MNAKECNIRKSNNPRRAKTKTASSTSWRVYELDEAGQGQFGNPKRQKKIRSSESNSNAFLKTTFLPKLKENETANSLSQRKKNKMERDFFKSLSQMSEHYNISQSVHTNLEFPYNLSLSFFHSQKQIKKKIKNWQDITLKKKGNDIYFVSEERCNTGMTLFYIPVVPLYKMLHSRKDKKTAQLLLSVCTYLYQSVDIPYYRQESSYLFWLYEMLDEWIDQDEELDEDSIHKKQLKMAEVIGDFMEQKISNVENLNFFQNRIESFKPNGDFEKECLEIAQKAFELSINFPNERIYRNVYLNNNTELKDFDEDNYEDDETVISIEKYVSFFADSRGWVYDKIVDTVNNEFNQYGDIQEPIIYKVFNGSNVSGDSLDFENSVFEVINRLVGVFEDYSNQ